MGRALRATSSLEGPPCQNPWAHAPLPQHPHLGPSLCSLDSRQFGPASLLGLILILGWPPKGLPKGPGSTTLGIVDPEHQRQTHNRQATTRAHRGATAHSGWENGQGPPSPQ